MILPYKFHAGYPEGYWVFLGRGVLYFGIFVIWFNWEEVSTWTKILIFLRIWSNDIVKCFGIFLRWIYGVRFQFELRFQLIILYYNIVNVMNNFI